MAVRISDGSAPLRASAAISSISRTSSIRVALNLTRRSATLSGSVGCACAGRRYMAFIRAMRWAKGLVMRRRVEVVALDGVTPLSSRPRRPPSSPSFVFRGTSADHPQLRGLMIDTPTWIHVLPVRVVNFLPDSVIIACCNPITTPPGRRPGQEETHETP